MRRLEGGCSVPLGVWTSLLAAGEVPEAPVGTWGPPPTSGETTAPLDTMRLHMRVSVTSVDGAQQLRAERLVSLPPADSAIPDAPAAAQVAAAEALGVALALDVLAQGADAILAACRK